MLGGGSNLVVADERLPRHRRRGRDQRRPRSTPSDEASLRRRAGHGRRRRELGRRGRRSPSTAAGSASRRCPGSPASVGATPIQNVGAYGQEVTQTVAPVRVWDRTLRGVRTFANADCGFGYRTSRFKADPGRHVVLVGDLPAPRRADLGAPVAYAELARALGVELGERAPAGRRARGGARACAAARAWCSTRPTTTPGAPARSSPTRWSTPRPCPRARPPGRSRDGRGQDQRRLADRARRLRQGVRRRAASRCRPSTPSR